MQKNKMEVFFVLFINILFPVDQCNSDMSVFTEFTDFLFDFFKKKSLLLWAKAVMPLLS